jgi:adenylate cyclase
VKTKNFFAELKRRKVYRVAVAYAIVSWLLIQIATQVFPFFEVPMWAVRLVIILLALGFPVALLLAWAFDLTPGGIKRTDDLDESQQQNVAGSSKSIRATQIAPPPEKASPCCCSQIW